MEEPPALGFVLALWSWYRKTSAALFLELQGGKFAVTINLRRVFRNIGVEFAFGWGEKRDLSYSKAHLGLVWQSKLSEFSITSRVKEQIQAQTALNQLFPLRVLLQKKCTPEKSVPGGPSFLHS